MLLLLDAFLGGGDGIWGLDFCLLITWPYIDAKLDVDEDHIALRSKQLLVKSDMVLY